MAAEAFGLAASALSVVGLAGQLAQGSIFLHGFLRDIRDAPADIKSLSSELQIISSTLTTIHHSYDIQDADLEQVLRHSEQVINGLSTKVKTIGLADDLPEWKKIRQQVRAVLNRSESAKHLRALERSKSALLQCCTNAIRKSQSAQAGVAVDTYNIVLDTQETTNSNKSTITETHRAVVDARNSIVGTGRTILDTQKTVGEIRADTSNIGESSVQIKQITSETRTLVNRLTDDTLHVRDVTERIEAASRELLAKPQNIAPELLHAFTKEVPRMMSKSVCRQLERMVREQVNQNGSGNHMINPRDCGVARIKTRTEDESVCGGQLSSSIEQVPDHPADHWRLKSSTTTRRRPFSNSFVGTLTITTTVKSYIRQKTDRSGRDEKQERRTTVTFLPATWLMSKGAVLAYDTWKRIEVGPWQNPVYSLKTVNIVPLGSEIFRACLISDLASMRTLFDNSQASPSDMSPDGLNLLGWVALGAFVRINRIQRTDLIEIIQMVNLLISLGVDAGGHEVGGLSSLELLSLVWLASEQLDDKYSFLFSKLLLGAKTDPFTHDASMTMIVLDTYSCNPTAVEVLLHQTEWPISWHPTHLLMLLRFGRVPGPARSFVMPWAMLDASSIEASLQAQLGIIRSFLASNAFPPQEFPRLGQHAISELIHYGGLVIALLSEHDDGGSDPPCLHRLRKLGLARTFMITAIGLLLEYWRPYLATRGELDPISIHAQQHNMRTMHIWRMALENTCGNAQDTYSDTRPANYGTGSTDFVSADGSQKVNNLDEDEWETEYSDGSTSGWETEEEWEEGYLLDAAVDRVYRDAANTLPTRINRCTRCEFASNGEAAGEEEGAWADGISTFSPLFRLTSYSGILPSECSFAYDEDYWQHVYSWVESEQSYGCLYHARATDQVPETLAKAADLFIASSKGR
ncbi:uncharacterized protein Z520_02358 [Fonsecaea multimorphosa CBS 102226]|uniref:Fungal N-terminal domain-containing protein n=1 Tax=Fonsecaea multimorphosa CBS 102226 TaxID=1442371 RepID=A0A0D2KFG8_9EURO|nr:uncharacterized protein Z520_02358 [Fonsecaea multimorphosa CBS 102226]KIY02220.1 hypothetical protein Z520_02358 [Fonsecaea multimorphosa CBS 102226]OAL29411.1 hypothetical protein AYO22_02305 [Fonsecaea multimorphosa]